MAVQGLGGFFGGQKSSLVVLLALLGLQGLVAAVTSHLLQLVSLAVTGTVRVVRSRRRSRSRRLKRGGCHFRPAGVRHLAVCLHSLNAVKAGLSAGHSPRVLETLSENAPVCLPPLLVRGRQQGACDSADHRLVTTLLVAPAAQ